MPAALTQVVCQFVDGMFVLKTEAQTKQYGACVSINPTPDRSGVKSIVVWKEGSGRAEAVCICDGRDELHPRRPEMDAGFLRALDAAKTEDMESAEGIIMAALADPSNEWPEELTDALQLALTE